MKKAIITGATGTIGMALINRCIELGVETYVLVNPESKDLAGAGLKRVCELAQIPPVLPLGSLEKIGNVVMIAGAVSGDSGFQ